MMADPVGRVHGPFNHALVIHSGALGDTVLMLSLVGALGDAGIQRVSLLSRGLYRPLLELCPDIRECHDIDTGGHHALFSADAEIPQTVVETLKQHDLAVNMLTDPTHAVRNRLMQIGLQAVADIDPKQRDDFRGHITEQWLADLRQSLKSTRLAFPRIPPAPQLIPHTKSAQSATVSGGVGVAPAISRCHTDALRDKLMLLHPGSGSRAKCWPLANFIDLAHRLIEENRRVAFLLGPVEQERFDKTQIAALRQTAPIIATDDLRELAGILSNAEAVVANDSGIAHLAAALGTHVVAIFGPTDPRRWQPLGPRVDVLHATHHWPEVQSIVNALRR